MAIVSREHGGKRSSSQKTKSSSSSERMGMLDSAEEESSVGDGYGVGIKGVGGDLGGQLTDTTQSALRQYIYSYSFALSPEEHQPSGTCNFSRIDNAVLQLDYTGKAGSKNLKVFAVNYNVLRIMSGMGGLAYSN